MPIRSRQMMTGKAFEFALLSEFRDKLKSKTSVEVVENSSYLIAKECFVSLDSNSQSENLLYASFAVNFLIDLEPRLANGVNSDDFLQLELLADNQGQLGDVRDVLIIRKLQDWEIGVSAKNNHRAVKHSRLSKSIDFGQKWLGYPCSKTYFEKVFPIFDKLDTIKKQSNRTTLWSSLGDYHTSVYVPILIAFIEEMNRLYSLNSNVVANRLVEYLVGIKDYYKVIKLKNALEVHAYNIHGTLNQSFNDVHPKYRTPIVKLPSEINSIKFAENSKTTIHIEMNNNWKLSFRIHNASSRVEPSLKFDINLIESPSSLFKNKFSIV